MLICDAAASWPRDITCLCVPKQSVSCSTPPATCIGVLEWQRQGQLSSRPCSYGGALDLAMRCSDFIALTILPLVKYCEVISMISLGRRGSGIHLCVHRSHSASKSDVSRVAGAPSQDAPPCPAPLPRPPQTNKDVIGLQKQSLEATLQPHAGEMTAQTIKPYSDLLSPKTVD